MTSFAIYAALFSWFTQHIDHYAKLPRQTHGCRFCVGRLRRDRAMAANANDAILAHLCKDLRPGVGAELGCGAGGPFTEEWAKGSGLLLLIAMAQRQVRPLRRVHPGRVHRLGISDHRGHYLRTDIGRYPVRGEPDWGVGGTIPANGERGAAHILYSAIFCAGLVYLFGRPAEPRKLGGAAPGRDTDAAARDVGLVGRHRRPSAEADRAAHRGDRRSADIFAQVYKLTVRERDFVRDVMAPEEARNVITPAELNAMAGNRKARKAYRKAARKGHERKRARYVSTPPMPSATSWLPPAAPTPTGCACPRRGRQDPRGRTVPVVSLRVHETPLHSKLPNR